ncbi:hypothetical protein BDY17DRAFT_111666 [Neohortaea acidophila]|uniref:Uncharacterized protein n=1 Tax=Neohortaea acidophila TaxID=245834 RepID=A0A6A6Q0I3_9PEZI|nr:uncharacterized protein BDY17DRAFT_111666 [Neohortaea acidophila]KAF2485792.1 hypothetical protein BDY17DRAFT_111666 [Neohortaea acidophila]
MPASTRSSKKQVSLEDVGAGRTENANPSSNKASSNKRKASEDNASDSVTINRAPVLELWASCVTQFLYPSLSWSTCLSAGGAISTITAIAKGRSIGKIDKPDPEEAEKRKQARQDKAEKEELDEIEPMSFKLSLDNEGHAMVGGKPKKPNEETLAKKYGEQYDSVKETFKDALKAWKSREDDLNSQAFGMYEQFRPTVPPGQSGWGRKGQLNLEAVKSAVSGD